MGEASDRAAHNVVAQSEPSASWACMNLQALSVPELLRLHAAAVGELRSRGVVRTGNNPIGDYTEWLVARALGLTLAANSSAGYDALAPDNTRVQIKGRRVSQTNRAPQLSAIRNLQAQDFDVLVAVVFNDAFDVMEAISVPHAVIGEYAAYRKHVNAHILHVRGSLLEDPRVTSVRRELMAVMHPGLTP